MQSPKTQEKDEVDHTTHHTPPSKRADVIQHRHPTVKMPLQNRFPQVSSSLLRGRQSSPVTRASYRLPPGSNWAPETLGIEVGEMKWEMGIFFGWDHYSRKIWCLFCTINRKTGMLR